MTKCKECKYPTRECKHHCGVTDTVALVRDVVRANKFDVFERENESIDAYRWQEITVPLCNKKELCTYWMEEQLQFISQCLYYSENAIKDEIEKLVFHPDRDSDESRYKLHLWFCLLKRKAEFPDVSRITLKDVQDYKENLRARFFNWLEACKRPPKIAEEQMESSRQILERNGKRYVMSEELSDALQKACCGAISENDFNTILSRAQVAV